MRIKRTYKPAKGIGLAGPAGRPHARPNACFVEFGWLDYAEWSAHPLKYKLNARGHLFWKGWQMNLFS